MRTTVRSALTRLRCVQAELATSRVHEARVSDAAPRIYSRLRSRLGRKPNHLDAAGSTSTMSTNVAAFSGSLRMESFTTKLVKAFRDRAPDGVSVRIVNIGGLPLLNEDLEKDLPPPIRQLHECIEHADAILLATPEYNRSFSPVLKNALDWGSRPAGQNKWKNKPTAVIGCTPYSLGAFGAQNHLRQVLTYLDMPTLQQPEFYLGKVAEKFNPAGELIDPATGKKIAELWDAFVAWIKKFS